MQFLIIQILFFLVYYSVGRRLQVHKLENYDNSKSRFLNCGIQANQRKLDIIPGIGWDNLENLEMGRILNLNYSQCLYSYDNQYLIPDQLSLSPRKVFQAEMISEKFDNFLNYTSMTSKSINLDRQGNLFYFKLGGIYSNENIRIKKEQLESYSIITRIQLRYNFFQSMFEPDTPLYPTFRNRIMDIAALIVENKDSLYPEYLADEIIRDYGTHVIRSIDAGAILSKVDVLNSRYSRNFKKNTSLISALALAAFNRIFGIKSNYGNLVTEKETKEYINGISKTYISTIGSISFFSNTSLQKWEESILDNLATIDRRGEPIYNVLTPRVLPKLDYKLIHKLKNLLKKALNRYFSANIRKGCLNRRSPNFNPDANIDSGSCDSPVVNFTFGGVYQTCSGPPGHCNVLIQKNPLTGSYSCPEKFRAMKLYDGLNRCQESCYYYFLIWRCDNICSNFATFWCYPIYAGVDKSGYQFGGIMFNPSDICPLKYYPLKLGRNSKICVAPYSHIRNKFSMGFGGLYSCNYGNPLAENLIYTNNQSSNSNLLKRCPDGYITRIANFERDCPISYCTETRKVSIESIPRVRKPPFIELTFNPNSTSVTGFKINNKEMLIKNQEGNWEIAEIPQTREDIYLSLIFLFFAVSILICGFTLFYVKKYYKKRYITFDFMNFKKKTYFLRNF